MTLQIIACSIISALIILVGHWLPWPRKLRRPEAYGYGILAIMLPFTAICLKNGWYLPMIAAWCCVGAAGMMTLGAYAYDRAMQAINVMRLRDGNED